MTKEPQKTNDDVIAKIKAEEEAKKEAARIAAEQAKIDPDADNKAAKQAEKELAEQAEKQAAKIARAERDEDDVLVNETPHKEQRKASGRIAAEKLRLIALSYPVTSPDEHVIFGFGGYKYTLGDLRDLVGIR